MSSFSLYRCLLTLTLVILVTACNSQSDSNEPVGNVSVSGIALDGNIDKALVTIVGIDSNGQPNTENGEYLGASSLTDNRGYFQTDFYGGNTSSVLVILKAYSGSEGKTRIRCVWFDGCQSTASTTVNYGDWYDAPEDFELWALSSTLSDGDSIYVTYLTHLAAKLAHTDFISDGTQCTDNSCVGSLPVDGMITPTSAIRSNDQVAKIFELNAFPTQIEPWSPFISSEQRNSAQYVYQGMHGLLSQAIAQTVESRLADQSSWKAALEEVVNQEFLALQGQVYQNHATAMSLESLIVLSESQVSGANDKGISSAKVSQANSALQARQSELVLGETTTAVGTAASTALSEQIANARDFIQRTQSWFTGCFVDANGSCTDTGGTFSPGLEQGDTTVFLGADLTAEVNDVKSKWQHFEQKLAPEMGMLFQPIALFSEYILSCVRAGMTTNNCDASHPYHAFMSYSASTNKLTLNGSVTGPHGGTVQAKIVAIIDQPAADSEDINGNLVYRISFEGSTIIESGSGKVTVTASDGLQAAVALVLRKELVANSHIDIDTLQLVAPKLRVQSKNATGGFDDFEYEALQAILSAESTYDALVDSHSFDSVVGEWVSLDGSETCSESVTTDCLSPRRFNLTSVSLPGKLKDGLLSSSDVIEIGLDIRSKNASVYYPESTWPNLNTNLDMDALKNFGLLNGSEVDSSDLAGWLKDRDDLTIGSNLEGFDEPVRYVEFTEYSKIDGELREEILKLDEVADVQYGALSYPGGVTAIVLYKEKSSDTTKFARECRKVEGTWGCFGAQGATSLGCQVGQTLGNEGLNISNLSITQVFTYLRNQGCFPRVQIDGAGTFQIIYDDESAPDGLKPFTNGVGFPAKLIQKSTLGIEAMNLRVISRFKENNEDQEVLFINVLGAAPDKDNVTLGVSLTRDYRGYGSLEGLGLAEVVPVGAKTIWVAVGEMSTLSSVDLSAVTDTASIYYLQEDKITLAIKAFDNNKDADNSIAGYIRYAGLLVGTVHKEGNVFVVRYIDGTWQLL